MGTPAQIGKLQYNAALREARQANMNLKRVLRRMMDETPSQLMKALIGQAAMELSDNDSALNELDRIGRVLREPQDKR